MNPACCLLAMLLGQAPPLPFEQAVLAELNAAREHPRAYADRLRRFRAGFDGLVAHDLATGEAEQTREGVAAVDEAIAFLERQPPEPALRPGELLARGAAMLVADQQAGGGIGHVGGNGAGPGERVRGQGGDVYVSEVIAYGNPAAIDMVRRLIVDDGVARRGHRALIFSPLFAYAGIACGRHPTYRAMCVVDLAGTADGSFPLPASAR